MRRALIAGSSGLVGSHCLRFLLDSSDWDEIFSLVRRPSGLSHPKLREVVIGDFSRLAEAKLDHAETVFCCLGTTLKKAGSIESQKQVDVDYVLSLARLGLSLGAWHFLVVSSVGADPRSSSPYLRLKGEMETGISQVGYPAVDVLQPSVLLGERFEWRPAESLAQTALRLVDPLMHWLLPRYRAIAAEKVARAMVALAEDPQEGFHRHASETIPSIGAP